MNTTEFGNVFEQQVHDYFKSVIDKDQFYVKKEHCRFYWKKGYYSQQRKSDIIFDVAVEIWRPGATTFSFVILIECKRYTSRNVPVGDIEQFFQKVQQVAPGNSKAVLASNAGFDSGTFNFADSNKIALLRLASPSEVKWELERPPSLGAVRQEDNDVVEAALSLFGFTHRAMDLYAKYGKTRTCSFWNFVAALIESSDFTADELRVLRNPKARPCNVVPFIERSYLESQAATVLNAIGYQGGEVALADICALEAERNGLVVRTNVAPPLYGSSRALALGKISFSPLEIVIFAQSEPNSGRERFTLAHELAHLLLGHSRFIIGEYSDDEDSQLISQPGLLSPEIARLEYQANIFATSLLMPEKYFVAEFLNAVRKHDIRNKGFGMLYVDGQECNVQHFYLVTNALMQVFGVSRAAVAMRLQTLGLLQDVRTRARTITSHIGGIVSSYA